MADVMETSLGDPGAPPPLAPILNRCLPGSCLPANRGTLCWGQDGLLAYGANSLVVVVDPVTVQTFQCLARHKSPVVALAWGAVEDRRLQLASADSHGEIISWDVVEGASLRTVQDGNQAVPSLAWLAGPSLGEGGEAGALLLALHPPNYLVLWNMDSGAKVWKKAYGDTLLGLELDPFTVGSALIRCATSFLFVYDLHPSKCPKSEGKKFYVTAGKGGSPGRDGAAEQSEQASRKKSTKLRRMVRSMVLGVEDGSLEQGAAVSDCLQASYHRLVPGTVLLGYSKEVLVVDTELGQTVGVISLERSHSSLAALALASHRELLLLLHESGSVSVWSPRPGLSVAVTPLPKSQSMSSFPGTPAAGNPLAEAILEVSYELRASSDHVRLGKNCKVLGLALHPVSHTEAAFLTTDGRVFLLRLTSCPGTASLSLGVTALLPSLACPPLTVRMCPALTVKNWADYQPLLAVGNPSGQLSLVNVSTGQLLRELAVHTSPVLGIEWTSAAPAASVLSFAHCSVTGSSSLVRNELVHSDLRSGRTRHLRSEPGREPEESRITMVRVSHQKQYFVVAFAAAPFELWDLRKLCLLRTMPKKFPPITSLVWSPLHMARARKGGSSSSSSREGTPSLAPPPSGNKEQILLTDTTGQVYHFTVEGGTIKDGTKIPAEAGLGTVNCITWKSDLIVRGDSEGNINVYNVKTRECKNTNTGRGAVRKLCFSPGKNNLKMLVLYSDWVQIWDVRELDMINELRESVSDVEWASSDRVVLAGQDGAVKLAGLALAGTTSSALSYGREQVAACWGLLPGPAFQWAVFCLGHRPWGGGTLASLQEGLTLEQQELVVELLQYQGEGWLDKLEKETSLARKYLMVAQCLGLCWEASLWQLLCDQACRRPLGPEHGVLAGEAVFRARQEERCRLHLSRAGERADRVQVTAQLICLGQAENAVGLLLDSEPGDETYMADQLLACLIQATADRGGQDTTARGQTLSTVKMVATNLLSEGRLWEGVQLLALTGQVAEAVSYLRSAGHWGQALWLARCRLRDQEFAALQAKYCDYLVLQGRVKDACVSHMASGRPLPAVEALHLAQHRSLAARLLPLLQEQEQDTVSSCLQEAVRMEAARLLAGLGQGRASGYFCDILGEKGQELRLELAAELPEL